MSDLEQNSSESIEPIPPVLTEPAEEFPVTETLLETLAAESVVVEDQPPAQIIEKPATPPTVEVQNATTNTEVFANTEVTANPAPEKPASPLIQIVHSEEGDTLILVPPAPQPVEEKNYVLGTAKVEIVFS